jgi:PDZ domain-containing protein
MTQRTWAALLAVPLIIALGLYMGVTPLPFVTYAPGLTINVLGDNGDKPIISIKGHRTYQDDGELRMTTVSVSQRDAKLDLFTLMSAWGLSRDDALYPYSVQYGDDGSQQQDAHQGQLEMAASQRSAEVAALTGLGYDLHPQMLVISVTKGMPADGELRVHDVIVDIGGTPVTGLTNVGALIDQVPDGQSVPITVLRDGKRVTVHVTPVLKQGTRLVGITLKVRYTFPFKVSINISDAIGGPSAGLMFALSIYDKLTPGSLTGGATIAGTGEITADGTVGEIGGIQQKIVGARQDGAQLFLVPPANCADALTSNHGSMRLAKAATLDDAVAAVRAWAANHDAPLPQCTATSGATS